MTTVDVETSLEDLAAVDAGQHLIGNFYLRFPDKESFEQDAKDAGFWAESDDGGVLLLTAFGYNFDIIGVIDDVVQGADLDAGVEPVVERLPGWHVNFSGVLPETWLPYVITPISPVRGMR